MWVTTKYKLSKLEFVPYLFHIFWNIEFKILCTNTQCSRYSWTNVQNCSHMCIRTFKYMSCTLYWSSRRICYYVLAEIVEFTKGWRWWRQWWWRHFLFVTNNWWVLYLHYISRYYRNNFIKKTVNLLLLLIQQITRITYIYAACK